MMQRIHESDSESGTSLLIIAAAMFFILGVAAMAIDLGALRFDLRADRLATDAAASAGAASVDPFALNDAEEACNVAWAYLLLNLGDEGSSTTPPDCTDLSGACDPLVARETDPPGLAGPYEIVITHPLPDGHPVLGTQTVNVAIDGVSCQRFGVSIERTRDFVFAAALGFNAGTTEVHSVAKIAAGVGAGEVVPLLVLEPIACNALYTSGQGKLTVTHYLNSPGFVVVDSNGSKTSNPNTCGSSSWTIDAKGTIQGWIRVLPTPGGIPSAILSYALSGQPPAIPARSYDPGDLVSAAVGMDPADPPASWFRLYPRPLPTSRRITRAPIDWRYNCKAGYPDYPLDLANPLLGGIPIQDCPTAAAAHIDNLVASYGGAIGTSPGTGFARWTDLYPCTVNNGTWPGASIDVNPGNWWVDCPAGLVINNAKIVRFTGGDAVFDGGIELRSSAALIINVGGSADRIVFLRGGSLSKVAQASITLETTFAYFANGVVDLVGGSGGLSWTAPIAGNFEDLALWSESPLPHEIGGQAGNTLTGTFFTPLANPFVLKGQGGQFQTDAQFLTRRLEIGGDSEVRMQPDPDRQTLIPIREVRLIR